MFRLCFCHTKRKSRVWDCFQLLLIPNLHRLGYYSNPTENIRTRLVPDFREFVEILEYFLIFYKFIGFYGIFGISQNSGFPETRAFSELSSILETPELSQNF